MQYSKFLELSGMTVGLSAMVHMVYWFFFVMQGKVVIIQEPDVGIATMEFFMSVVGLVGLLTYLVQWSLEGRRPKASGRNFPNRERVYLGWRIEGF
jgi:hypothetical protein